MKKSLGCSNNNNYRTDKLNYELQMLFLLLLDHLTAIIHKKVLPWKKRRVCACMYVCERAREKEEKSFTYRWERFMCVRACQCTCCCCCCVQICGGGGLYDSASEEKKLTEFQGKEKHKQRKNKQISPYLTNCTGNMNYIKNYVVQVDLIICGIFICGFAYRRM